MSQSSRLPSRIINLLLISSLAGALFIAQSPAPAHAEDTTPTPVPTLIPPVDEPVPATPASQPAAEPRFKMYQDIVLDYIKMTSRTEGWGITGQTVLTTVNAGLTWHEASPPEPVPNGIEATAYGAFLDTKTAWVIICHQRADQTGRVCLAYDGQRQDLDPQRAIEPSGFWR